MTRLQDERRLTSMWQDDRTGETYIALKRARSRTDIAVARFNASEAKLKDSADADTERGVVKELKDLTKQRNRIDLHAATRGSAYRYYTGVTAAGTTLLTDVLHSEDGQLAHNAAAVTSLVHIAELISREDALLSGAHSSGRMSPAFRQAFLGHVASQRQVAGTLNTRDIPGAAAEDYQRTTDKPQWAVLQNIQAAVDADTTGNTTRNTTLRRDWIERADKWRPAADVVGRDLRDGVSASLDSMAEHKSNRADDALLTAVAGSAVVLAVLAFTTVLAVRSSRSLSRRLSRLSYATTQWTDRVLPDLVDRYERGDLAGVAAEMPYESSTDDEVGRLVAAVREQQRTAANELGGLAKAIDDRWKAAALTSEQKARKRDGAETVVLGLLRRNQLLISQLITLIDSLERREHDPELLTDIFKIDHLVTRLRRDLENQSLIVGVQPGRRWSRPVPVFQVLRSAVAETVDYTRVEVETAPEFSLSGRVVADVGHILAALIENGTSFSPPHTNVIVSAEEVAEGRLVVEVIDRGLGMNAERYEELNRLLADPPEPDVTRLGEIPQLGLFVVALLANRIGLEITLCRSAYGGTKAVVLIPSDLLEEAPPLLPRVTEPARE
ncbi:MAG: nitrate- and nitrite sensing domain-containing protein, partial [Streptomyces sp.]